MSKNKNENFAPTLFGDIFNDAKLLGRNWFEKEFGHNFPAVNINETTKEYNLEFAAPGFKKENFKIDLDENVITISAEKEEEKNEGNKRFTRKEYSFNSFSRSFTLPETVNGENIDAKYDNGILKLSLPKKEESKVLPKKEIKVA